MQAPLLLLLLLPVSLTLLLASGSAADRIQLHSLHRLRVNGCPLLGRGRVAKEGLRLSLDPAMCVSGSFADSTVAPHDDPIAKQAYISVPVMLSDEAMLTHVGLQLRHLAPSTVAFATVTKVTVSVDPGSVYAALGFIWSQGEPTGWLRLGCNSTVLEGTACKVEELASNLRSSRLAALDRVLLTASVSLVDEPGSTVQMDYRLAVRAAPEAEAEARLVDYSVSSRLGRDWPLTSCGLTPVRSVRVGNCSALAYRQRGSGQLLVEAPVCYAGVEADAQADYSTGGKRGLTLRVRVPTGAADLDEAARQLDDLKPKSVAFMQMWGAGRVVSGFLAGRFDVGPLMLAEEEGQGLVRVRCNHAASCRYLISQVRANPLNFWRHVEWHPVFAAPLRDSEAGKAASSGQQRCGHSPAAARYAVTMAEDAAASAAAARPAASEGTAWRDACRAGSPCRYRVLADGRHFVVVQQREAGRFSFDRPWADYVAGFGDDSDFWIGLTALHLLTSHGVNLRLEMTQWNGTEMRSEYSGFKVASAGDNFRMTYRAMIESQSNVNFDAMETSKGQQFSTFDRDHDNNVGSCSQTWGSGGWWFNQCYKFYPNGLFPTTVAKDWKYIMWASNTEVVPLRMVRMMIQV